MQFKNPEVLYFLFLLIVPFLVHLFQLRRFKKEYFTNVAFLKVLSIQTRKSSKLKKWLLLATRLLILAAIIFAFSQPYFKAAESKSINNELFIILDNSFSMQAKGQKGELLQRAIQDLLENVPENQTFSLITNTENFWRTDIKAIQKELQNLKYSATPFEIDNQIAQIKSQKSNINKDIVVISDGLDIKTKQLQSIDKNLNTFFIIPKAEQKNNISIDSVYLKTTTDKFYEIDVKLTAFGEISTDIPIALYNNNKLIAKTLTQFDTKSKTINFSVPKTDFDGFVSITDNGLEFDNTYYFNISKPKKVKVLSIGNQKNNAFLKKIYTDSEFTFTTSELSTLDYNILDQQDAIVLNEINAIPQALQTTLKAFVNKGGNLIVVPSSENATSNLNEFLNNFGNLKFNPIQNKEKLITKIAINHPLLSNVFDKKVVNFQYPKTKNSFSITTSNPAILSFEDQSTFLTAMQNPISNVYVFAAPINQDNSNFQNSPLIVPVFYNMSQNGNNNSVSSFEIGKTSNLFLDESISKDEILTIKNQDEKFIPIQQILDTKVKLTFGDYPEKAGNFGVFKQNKLVKNISFNYNRSESDLAKSNDNAVADLKKIDALDTIFDVIKTNRSNTEVWKWFVIFALLFLILEILIQKFIQ